MTGTLIASTPKSSLRALAFQGITAYTSFPQIRDMLLRKFGDDYILIFARPVENLNNGLIDWYSPVQGIPQKLESLSDAEKMAICSKTRAMANEILAYAEELIHSPDNLKVTRGNILKLALSYPNDSYIHVIGKQPVLVCWGFGSGTPGVEPQSITRVTASKRPEPGAAQSKAAPEPVLPPVQPVSVPARNMGCLWWLLPLPALCVLLLLLFTSFGHLPALAGKSLINGPELPFLTEKPDKSTEIAVLEGEIAELEHKLREYAGLCRPEQPKVVQMPDASREKPAAPSQSEELVIPPKAEDAGFLEGKWLCDTGLANTRTREPVAVEFSFGTDGRGQGVTHEKNDKCAGAVNAQMRNGELHINLDTQYCQKNGHAYSPVSIICKNANGAAAECFGRNNNGTTWSASFKRIR